MAAAVHVGTAIFPILVMLIYLVFIVLGIVCIVLFIKLARRGIKAFDIYIDEKTNRPPY